MTKVVKNVKCIEKHEIGLLDALRQGLWIGQ